MELRSTSEVVELRHPFIIVAYPGVMPAGRYIIQTEEEMADGASSPAWRPVSMTISRYGLASGRVVRALPIDPAELDALLAAEARRLARQASKC